MYSASLMIAARHGDLEAVITLLAAGAAVDFMDSDVRTMLTSLSYTFRLFKCSKLYHFFSCLMNLNLQDGWTALMWAAAWGHTGVVRALLDAKADVDAQHKKVRALFLICSFSVIKKSFSAESL